MAAAPVAGDKVVAAVTAGAGSGETRTARLLAPVGSAKAGSVVSRRGQDVPTAAPRMTSRPRLLTMTVTAQPAMAKLAAG